MKYLLKSSDLNKEAAYRQSLYIRGYKEFCRARNEVDFPATLAILRLFLLALATRMNWFTLGRYVAAIRRRHEDQGLPDPFGSAEGNAVLRELRKRCRRSPDVALRHTQDIARVIDRMDSRPLAVRDRVLLLLVYCTRVSGRALSEMDRADVSLSSDGMRIFVRHAHRRHWITMRRYQDGRYCPVAAMERYLRLLEDDDTPALFRVILRGGSKSVGTVSPKRAKPSSLAVAILRRLHDPDNPDDHRKLRSLHASMVITASSRGATDQGIMRQMGYSRTSSVQVWKSRFHAGSTNMTERLGL